MQIREVNAVLLVAMACGVSCRPAGSGIRNEQIGMIDSVHAAAIVAKRRHSDIECQCVEIDRKTHACPRWISPAARWKGVHGSPLKLYSWNINPHTEITTFGALD